MFDEKILRILLILDINNNDNRNFIKENLKKIIVMNIFYYKLVVKIFVLVHFSSSQKKCKITMMIKKNCECYVWFVFFMVCMYNLWSLAQYARISVGALRNG